MRHRHRRSVKDVDVRVIVGINEPVNHHWWKYRHLRHDRWHNNDRWHWANHSQW